MTGQDSSAASEFTSEAISKSRHEGKGWMIIGKARGKALGGERLTKSF